MDVCVCVNERQMLPHRHDTTVQYMFDLGHQERNGVGGEEEVAQIIFITQVFLSKLEKVTKSGYP